MGAVGRYFRELKSELKKVVWSTPKQVAKNTLIVIACVLIVGLFVWLFDFVAQVSINALIDGVHSLSH
ncbi:MAG: preprotein translocase subunit SecE [Ruminococcaceae bacterium]|nr:preprotein translocase subunit SecE [Oscillospiraceae bacterium]